MNDLGGNRPPGDNPLLFSISGTGSLDAQSHKYTAFFLNRRRHLTWRPLSKLHGAPPLNWRLFGTLILIYLHTFGAKKLFILSAPSALVCMVGTPFSKIPGSGALPITRLYDTYLAMQVCVSTLMLKLLLY